VACTALRTWYASIRNCMPYMAAHVLGSPRHWRMLPTHANGQPAVAAYTRSYDDNFQPYGIVVLDTRQRPAPRDYCRSMFPCCYGSATSGA
jgi:hypothetical protein